MGNEHGAALGADFIGEASAAIEAAGPSAPGRWKALLAANEARVGRGPLFGEGAFEGRGRLDALAVADFKDHLARGLSAAEAAELARPWVEELNARAAKALGA